MGFGILTLLTTFRLLFIPAEFQDAKFSLNSEELHQKILQCQDYYNSEFVSAYGIDEFVFECAPTISLSQTASFYGSNYSDRKDVQIHQAIREACTLSNNAIDFSKYDSTNCGTLDVLCILSPGEDETDTKLEESIYPQYLSLKDYGVSLTLDGKIAEKFVVVCESSDIGVFCHELAHHFGLPDFYDTDYEGSGGRTNALAGTSLMDEGCKLNSPPPFLNAIELEVLGIGTCDTLKVGQYTLEPINRSRSYLKVIGTNKDEYYLLDCEEDSGLRIFYVDKSNNKRGYSDYFGKELNASERWAKNEVNNRPDMECAYLLREIMPFSFFDGTSSSFAITDIVRAPISGNVSFNIVQPIELGEISSFQDAAIIRWKVGKNIDEIDHYELSWKDAAGEEQMVVIPYSTTYYIIEQLEPHTQYSFSLKTILNNGSGFTITRNFTTKPRNKGTKAYIYLNQTERNPNGTFRAGAKIQLRIFNGSKVARTEWFFNDQPARIDRDGYFIVREQGTLKVNIQYENGGTETIIKEIQL